MELTKLEASIDGIIDGGRRIPAERRAHMAISGSDARGNGYFILILGAFFSGLLLLSYRPAAFAQQAVFLIRHADRLDPSLDPPLSPAGQVRAEQLAMLLKHTGISAIYTSEWQRTIATAEPLAAILNIEPVKIPRTDVAGLVERIHSEHSDGVVLIVGHQKTVPLLLKRFGHSGDVFMERSEYDNLFVVIPKKDHEPTVLHLRY
jgi:broad specificity phosphatase PhoE